MQAVYIDIEPYSLGGARVSAAVRGDALGFSIFLEDGRPASITRAGYLLTSVMATCGTEPVAMHWAIGDSPLCAEIAASLRRFPLDESGDDMPEISRAMTAMEAAIRAMEILN